MVRLCGLLTLLISVGWHALVFAQEPSQIPEQGFSEVPGSILVKARDFIISRVGEEFYAEHVALAPSLIKFVPAIENSGTPYLRRPHYDMRYIFSVRGDSLMRSDISFSLDMHGEVIPEARIRGLPECAETPGDCLFPIDREKAIEIARSHGLEDGLKEWRVRFHWDNTWETYVWEVWNTLWVASPEERRDPQIWSRGRRLIIAANCGRIIEDGSWEKLSAH